MLEIKVIPDSKRGEYVEIFLLFILTLLLRMAYSLFHFYKFGPPPTNAYFEIANIMLDQGELFYDAIHPYYESSGPLLPWINAITMQLFGRSYLSLYIVTSIISSLITVFTFKLASELFDRKIAWVTAIWSALYLFYFFYTPTPGKDIWMSFFMITLTYLYYRLFITDRFNYPSFILFTVLFVASFHLDERFFVFGPFIGGAFLIKETKGLKKFSIIKTSLFVVLIILLMIPWTVRNYRQHNKVVIVSTRTQQFTDKLFGYESSEHHLDFFNDPQGAFYINETNFDSVISGEITTTDGGRPISHEQVKAMRRGRLPREFGKLEAAASRLLTMFEPVQIRGRYERTGYYYYKKSSRHNLVTFMFYGLPFLFSIPGFIFLYRDKREIAVTILTVIIIYALIHALTIPYANWRYRLPLDAFFIIAGSYGAVTILNQIKHRYKTG